MIFTLRSFTPISVSYLNPIWNCAPRYLLNWLLLLQKKALRNIHSLNFRDSVKSYFSGTILPIEYFNAYHTAVLIFSLKNDLIKHTIPISVNSDLHNHYTRGHNLLHTSFARSCFGQYIITGDGFRVFNNLPESFRSIGLNAFKSNLKAYLLHCFHAFNDYNVSF